MTRFQTKKTAVTAKGTVQRKPSIYLLRKIGTIISSPSAIYLPSWQQDNLMLKNPLNAIFSVKVNLKD
jgi:hypothetical protein